MLNAAVFLEHGARAHPDRTALVFEGRRTSYAALDRAANRAASGLRAAGFEAGDHVALCCPNRPEFVIAYYGVLKLGATVVTVSALSKSREIAYYLADSDAKALICYAGRNGGALGRDGYAAFDEVDHCEQLWIIGDDANPGPTPGAPGLDTLLANQPDSFDTVPTPPGQTAAILYTSGTTGQPKGAELTHSNIVMNVVVTGAIFPARCAQTQLVALPLFHVYAQTCLMHQGFHTGDTLVLMQRFEPGAALRLLIDEGVTRFAGVPTMYWSFLNHPDFDKPSAKRLAENLEYVATGGAPMPEAVAEAFQTRTGIPLFEGYGCTETSPVVVVQPPDEDYRQGSVGKAIWGVEVRVVDTEGRSLPADEIGEIIVRGHCVMKGYYNRPEETAKAIRDGWYYTGDLGRLDDDGYLYIEGRTKELIIRGGFNVYPQEVENALMEHPKVGLAAVVGVADERYGEEVKAFVVPAPGAEVSAGEIVAWAKENMAAHKYPRLVELRESLPFTATGKVLKRDLT